MQRRTVFETEWFAIEELSGPLASDSAGRPHYRMVQPDAAMVLGLTEAGDIVLVRQFRPAVGEHTLELPAGGIDPGEAPEEAAARETFEETGYRFRKLTFLGWGRFMMSRVGFREYVFFGEGGFREDGFQQDEGIETVLVSPARLAEMVLSGDFNNYSALSIVKLVEMKTGRTLMPVGESTLR